MTNRDKDKSGFAPSATPSKSTVPGESGALPTTDAGSPRPVPGCTHETMAGKPVIYRNNIRTIVNLMNEAFAEKGLCDGLVMNLGDACAYRCSYCYVGPQVRKLVHGVIDDFNLRAGNLSEGDKLSHQDLVIRRGNPMEVLERQLVGRNGADKYNDPTDTRIVFCSSLVDVGANLELLRETAQACMLILEHTQWQIRLLSKGNLLPLLVKNGMIPEEYHHRLIFGFSTGTLSDPIAQAIEGGTALVSKRLAALGWLQCNGYRTFGMVCPSLPQADYDTFSREILEAINWRKCEHVWCEPINLRGESLACTTGALRNAGFEHEARLLKFVIGSRERWETYARATFAALARILPPEKLRFLQYVRPETVTWWSDQQNKGAVLLGRAAAKRGPMLASQLN